MKALPASARVLLVLFLAGLPWRAVVARGGKRVRVAVVARQGSDWRAKGLAGAALAHLCQVQRVFPANARAAQRLVPAEPDAPVAKVADAGRLLRSKFVVVVDAPARGEAAAELVDVAARKRLKLTARAPQHELPGKLALALVDRMPLNPYPFERIRLVRPMVATEAAIEALWQGIDAQDPKQQLRSCKAAASQDPDSALVHNQLGVALARLGRVEQALEAFDRAVQLRSGYAAAYTNRGLLLKQQKRWRQAEEAFHQAIALGTKSPTPHIGLARLLDCVGAAREAADQLEKAVALDPSHVGALMTLANYYFECYKIGAATRNVQRVLELEPRNAAALNLLGLLQLAPRRYEEAEARFRQALEIQPNSATTLANLGLALYGQGRVDEAIATLQRAIELDRTCAQAHLYLGRIHMEQRQYDEATTAFQHAAELNPKLRDARHGLLAARAARRQRPGPCGCLPGLTTSPGRRYAALGALFPVALLLAPHLVRVARRRRRGRH